MPQLDSTTFLSQFFWLTVVFLFLYIFTLKNILPQIGAILKVRRKRLEMNKSQLDGLKGEEEAVIKKFDSIYSDGMAGSRKVLAKTAESTQNWHNKSLKEANSTDLLPLNEMYITTLAYMSGVVNVIFREDITFSNE